MDLPARLATQTAALAAVLVLGWDGAQQAGAMPDDLASHFATAPDTAPAQQQLVQVTVNGLDYGSQLIGLANGGITLPPATVKALGLIGRPDTPLDLSPDSDIAPWFDEAQASLALTVPPAKLASQRFAPEVDPVQARLTPETWGAYVNYDLNLRHALRQGSSSALAYGPGAGGRAPGFGAGGLADLQVLAPQMFGSFGWAYDSSLPRADAVIRLDSTATWRPDWLNLAISAGDMVSLTPSSIAQARAYRFGGVQVGTDYSGSPGWSNSPIASVTGTAQAQSAIDVYLDGQRTYHSSTPGGAFSLVLPPGSAGIGTNVVITDVTGRAVVLPVQVPLVDARLLRQGLFLWSAGAGTPRFAYGSSLTGYSGTLYGYGNARYGVQDTLTASVHAEASTGLAELETGADMAITPWFAAHALVAASHSARGAGGAGRVSAQLAGPWHVMLEATIAHTIGCYDDAVSVSGRDYGRNRGIAAFLSLPASAEESARLSWQLTPRLSVSASYQANTYPGSPAVGFASLGTNYLLGGRIPLFANLSHAIGGQRDTAVVAGLSVSFGSVQASASGGYGTSTDSLSRSRGQGNVTGGFTAAQAMGEAVGDVGWDAYATRAPGSSFANVDAQMRTGYGVPGLAAQTFGNQVTGYATLRGTAGVVGMHPFLSDPASGGIIIADAGQPGVPVQLNGYDRGRTGLDGQIALPGAVPGVPQRVAIDTADMTIDAVPSDTDQLVVVREHGAAMASFGVQLASSSAIIGVAWHGQPPPVGSTLVSASSSAPISKEGRAYLPSLAPNEVLTVEMPGGETCRIRTRFDGKGGVSRRLGTLPCEEAY